MATNSVSRDRETVACAVCGRRLLQGEEAEIYLVGGSRRTVCELCTVRANSQGWIRERAGVQLRNGNDQDRRPLFERLRPKRDRRGAAEGAHPPVETDEGLAQMQSETPELSSFTTPEQPREPRHVRAVPSSNDLKTDRAVELFNSSEHPRTVASVARSLGMPVVVVVPNGERASIVDVVVSWELCWYRYEVDLADESGHGVRTAAQGYELGELTLAQQTRNASADDTGALALAA